MIGGEPAMVGLWAWKSATRSAGLDWQTLDAMWAAAGETDVFDAGWMSDHLSDASRERGGVAFEPFTTLAALAHRLPGRWLGVAVASATFRHPALLGKAATVLDNVTGGRFILGLGAGWHQGEHDAFGIPLPPLPERFDRLESELRVLEALFGTDASAGRGVTLDDPSFPLREATNEPSPIRPGGPAIWLGGQKRRGIDLAVRYAGEREAFGRPIVEHQGVAFLLADMAAAVESARAMYLVAARRRDAGLGRGQAAAAGDQAAPGAGCGGGFADVHQLGVVDAAEFDDVGLGQGEGAEVEFHAGLEVLRVQQVVTHSPHS